MDKIGTNNYIVILRKELKHSKAMVSGNLIRKIKNLKEKKEKIEDEAGKVSCDKKIARVYSETKLLKTLDTYPIAKDMTLNPDKEVWNKLLSDNKATPEQRLACRIILKNNVQKCVNKFRQDHKDCDEWLEEYFEFREKKKQLEEAGQKRRRRKRLPRNQGDPTKVDENEKQIDKSKTSVQTSDKPQAEETAAEPTIKANEPIHPSWAIKKKQKELLKSALSKTIDKPSASKRIILNADG